VKVSVVLRVKNEGRDLRAVLERVFAQRHPEFEVIVVDSGSTDDTLAIARSFPARLIEIPPESFTYGRALNVGARAAEGEVVVFLSGHALPFDRDWLAHLVAPLDDPGVAGVTGNSFPREDASPFDRRGLRRRYGTDAEHLPTRSGVNYSNANGAVRRRIWEAVPFDETLPYSEDLDWQRRVRALGRRLVYSPRAIVRHSHDEPPRALGRRMYEQSRARTTLRIGGESYHALRLAIDLVAGTAYDWTTVLLDLAAPRWIAVAPLRRAWMNAGRYLGSRGMEWTGKPFRAIALRQAARVVLVLGRIAGHLAASARRATGHGPIGARPERGFDDDRRWYMAFLDGAQMVLDLARDGGAHAADAAEAVAAAGGRVVHLGDGADALEAARELAAERGAANIEFRAADLESPWPVDADAFDRVLALDVIEHLDRRDAFVDEARRVLTRDGLVLLSAPNGHTVWKRLRRRLGLPSLSDPDHRVEYALPEIVAEVARGGFVVRETRTVAADSPWSPFAELAGAIWPVLGRRWIARTRRIARERPAESTGWHLVLELAR
jgi:rhamnosyltransferase